MSAKAALADLLAVHEKNGVQSRQFRLFPAPAGHHILSR
jgi:hypothetical protein